MAKYVMSEMNQAGTDIKSWANDTIETLNDKINSLDKMIKDTSNRGKLLNSIKDYSSYNVNVINAISNGLDLFETGFENATSAYNDSVGEDVNIDELIKKMDANKQLIDNIANQIDSLPKDEGILTFALNGFKGALEDINFKYSDLIEKFNQWNRTHSNDLNDARDTIKDTITKLTELGKLSFDSKNGYDFSKINTYSYFLLEDESMKRILISKGYITKDGKIKNEGFDYIKKNTNKEDDLTAEELKYSANILKYISSAEDEERLLKIAYSKKVFNEEHRYGQLSAKYELSKNFSIIMSAAIVKMSNDSKNVSKWSVEEMNSNSTAMSLLLSIEDTITTMNSITKPLKVEMVENGEHKGKINVKYYGKTIISSSEYFGSGGAGDYNMKEAQENYEKMLAKQAEDMKVLGFVLDAVLYSVPWLKTYKGYVTGFAAGVESAAIVFGLGQNATEGNKDSWKVNLNISDPKIDYIKDLGLNVYKVGEKYYVTEGMNTAKKAEQINNQLQSWSTEGIEKNGLYDQEKILRSLLADANVDFYEKGGRYYLANVPYFSVDDIYNDTKDAKNAMTVYTKINEMEEGD